MSIEIGSLAEILEVGKVVEWLLERMGRRVRVKEIKKAKDRDIDETLEVYERLFKEEHRVVSSDLVAWLKERNKGRTSEASLQQCLLIAKRKGSVVGVLKAIYCHESCCILIPYFGIDKKADAVTRRVASKMILRFFRKFLKRRWKKCRGIVFEADKPRVGMSKDELGECRARLKLFQDIARQQGRLAYEIKIEYSQPKMADAASYTGVGRRMALMVIPTKDGEFDVLNKCDVEMVLRFILLQVYGTTQAMPSKKRKLYAAYVRGVYDRMVNSLGEQIQLDA